MTEKNLINIDGNINHIECWQDIILNSKQELLCICKNINKVNTINDSISDIISKFLKNNYSLILEESNDESFNISNINLILLNILNNIRNSEVFNSINTDKIDEVKLITENNSDKKFNLLISSINSINSEIKNKEHEHTNKLNHYKKLKNNIDNLCLEKLKLKENVESAYNIKINKEKEEKLTLQYKDYEACKNSILSLQKDYDGLKLKLSYEFNNLFEITIIETFERYLIINHLSLLSCNHAKRQYNSIKSLVYQLKQSFNNNEIQINEYTDLKVNILKYNVNDKHDKKDNENGFNCIDTLANIINNLESNLPSKDSIIKLNVISNNKLSLSENIANNKSNCYCFKIYNKLKVNIILENIKKAISNLRVFNSSFDLRKLNLINVESFCLKISTLLNAIKKACIQGYENLFISIHNDNCASKSKEIYYKFKKEENIEVNKLVNHYSSIFLPTVNCILNQYKESKDSFNKAMDIYILDLNECYNKFESINFNELVSDNKITLNNNVYNDYDIYELHCKLINIISNIKQNNDSLRNEEIKLIKKIYNSFKILFDIMIDIIDICIKDHKLLISYIEKDDLINGMITNNNKLDNYLKNSDIKYNTIKKIIEYNFQGTYNDIINKKASFFKGYDNNDDDLILKYLSSKGNFDVNTNNINSYNNSINLNKTSNICSIEAKKLEVKKLDFIDKNKYLNINNTINNTGFDKTFSYIQNTSGKETNENNKNKNILNVVYNNKYYNISSSKIQDNNIENSNNMFNFYKDDVFEVSSNNINLEKSINKKHLKGIKDTNSIKQNTETIIINNELDNSDIYNNIKDSKSDAKPNRKYSNFFIHNKKLSEILDPKLHNFNNMSIKEAKELKTRAISINKNPKEVSNFNLEALNSDEFKNESIIDKYRCAFVENILLQGTFKITTLRIIFKSVFNSKTIFGKTLLSIPFKDILSVQKSLYLKIFDNSITIKTVKGNILFTSFVNRDGCLDKVIRSYESYKNNYPGIFDNKNNIGNINSNSNTKNLSINNVNEKSDKTTNVKNIIGNLVIQSNFLNDIKIIEENRYKAIFNKTKKIIYSQCEEKNYTLKDKSQFKLNIVDNEYISKMPAFYLFNVLFNPDIKNDSLGFNEGFWKSSFLKRKAYNITINSRYNFNLEEDNKVNEEVTKNLDKEDMSLNDFYNIYDEDLNIFCNNLETFNNLFLFNKSNFKKFEKYSSNKNNNNDVFNDYYKLLNNIKSKWPLNPFIIVYNFKCPLRKRMFVPDETRMKTVYYINFISPFYIIIDEKTYAYDIAYSSSFHSQNQYILKSDVNFDTNTGLFNFKTYYSIYYNMNFTKSVVIKSLIESEGIKEGTEAIKTTTIPSFKSVVDEFERVFLENYSSFQKHEYRQLRKLINYNKYIKDVDLSTKEDKVIILLIYKIN